MTGTPHIDMLRSPLGRARAAWDQHAPVHITGGAQRLTALALVPLTLWFIFSVIHPVRRCASGGDRLAVRAAYPGIDDRADRRDISSPAAGCASGD